MRALFLVLSVASVIAGVAAGTSIEGAGKIAAIASGVLFGVMFYGIAEILKKLADISETIEPMSFKVERLMQEKK